jgi:predicted nuclease of predicted toxin-antitoxin system
MATIRLYIDEDSMDRALLRALRARGVDVLTALEEGMIEREDTDHLEYATVQERVLYTYNVSDFYRLHTHFLAQGKSHTGMILAPQQRYSVGEVMCRLLKLINAKSAAQMNNSVEFLQAWGA